MKPLSMIVCVLFVSPGMAAEVKEEPLNVSVERAFPEMSFERPIIVTHANDGSDRVFVAEQEGVIKVFANDPDAEESDVFLNINDQVVYNDNKN